MSADVTPVTVLTGMLLLPSWTTAYGSHVLIAEAIYLLSF